MGKISSLFVVGLIVIGAGCNARPDTNIAEIAPYVGGRPAAIPHLPKVHPRKLLPRRPVASNDWTPTGGISKRWKAIVIHHSASDRSTPKGMRDWHVNGRGWVALGYDFVIGNGIGYGDGKVYVGERWRKQMHGAHCKTPDNFYNKHGIGICLIGNMDLHPPTSRQMAALSRLVSFLTQQCNIPQSKIFTHKGVTGKTACPGRYFSLGPVLRNLSHIRRVSAASQ